MRYAHIVDGVVDNIVEWDGVSEYALAPELISIPDGTEIMIGYTYDGTFHEKETA